MSTNFNVLRYSLLGAGVVYGAFHRYALKSGVEAAEKKAAYDKEVSLIKKAKAEFAKLNPPKSSTAGSINWEDPNLDFGQALESVIAKLD